MPTWLSDPPTTLYAVLAAGVVLPILAAMFLFSKPPSKRDPKPKISPARRWLFVISGISLLLLIGLFVCDRLYESDREQIVRKLNEMSAGIGERNLDKTFSHVSDSFRLGSFGKADVRARGDQALQQGEVTEIPVWDVNVEPVDKGATKANVRFRFKPKGSRFVNEAQFIGKAVFVREGDEWRLSSLDVFLPPNERDPIQMPIR